jgi:SAM-dependent methyltransferase
VDEIERGRVRYDLIGRGYRRQRQPDSRIASAIDRALGGARTVLNVGAGTGSYEPVDRWVVAAEPSREMVRQRPAAAAPVVRAVAESLPFADAAFDAAMAILTVHHWSNPDAGLAELCRVSRRQVVLTWDQAEFARFWLVAEYLPEIAEHERTLPSLAWVRDRLDAAVYPVPVPADCVDGFLGAYWRRPSAYLDARVRAAMSAIALLDQHVVRQALTRLRSDLVSGRWQRRHADLLDADSVDLGYRLLVAGPRTRVPPPGHGLT